MRNRVHNAGNPYQGLFPKVLCVCSAGLLRSPTTALVLTQEPWNCNTRAAGSEADFALIPVDEVLLQWANHIVFVNRQNYESVIKRFNLEGRSIYILDIPDNFEYRNPELMKIVGAELELVKFPKYHAGGM